MSKVPTEWYQYESLKGKESNTGVAMICFNWGR